MDMLPTALAVIGPVSVLAGVVITNYYQQKSVERQHVLNTASERAEFERSSNKDNIKEAESRAIRIHRMLGSVQREFSHTNLHIMWTAEPPIAEYNKRYLDFCNGFDETLALIHVHEPDLAKEAFRISGQMNKFWGGFMMLLEFTYKSEEEKNEAKALSFDPTMEHLRKSHEAASVIAEISSSMQTVLSQRAHDRIEEHKQL